MSNFIKLIAGTITLKNSESLKVISGSKKGFTLVELIVSMVLTTLLSTVVFNGIQAVLTAQNRDSFYRATYSSLAEGLTKGQKLIFENGTTLSGTLNTRTDSGSILSFIKEDQYGIERTYFINLEKGCLTQTNATGTRIVLTDGVTEPVKLSGCVFTDKYIVEQEVKYVNENLKEKILNYYIYLRATDDPSETVIKNTIFVK